MPGAQLFLSNVVSAWSASSSPPTIDRSTPAVPEVRIILSSQPVSSDSLIESITAPSTDIHIDDTSSSGEIDGRSGAASDPKELKEMVNGAMSPVQDGMSSAPSSSSWWDYIGWGSASPIPAAASADDVKDETTSDEHPSVTNEPAESPSPSSPGIHEAPENGQSRPSSPQTQLEEINAHRCTTSEVQDTTNYTEQKPPSELSANTENTLGSAWYSPWGWYAASPIVPQGPDMKGVRRCDPVKSESEQIKDNVADRAEGQNAGEASVAEPSHAESDEQDQEGASMVATPKPPSSPSASSNPIESSISTERAGWASFFMSRGLLTRGSDANKLSNRSDAVGEMEVMYLDEGHDTAGEVSITSPKTIDPGREASLPVASNPTSPSTDAPIHSPKEREPRKLGTPALPLTNNPSVKEGVRRLPSPAPSVKKTSAGASTPQQKPAPPNLVLPTWDDIFLSPPRNNPLPIATPPATHRGRLGKTLEFMSGVLFPDSSKSQEKGKTAEHGRVRSLERGRKLNNEAEFLTFGSELPKALEVAGGAFNPELLHGNSRVVVIGVAGWSPGTFFHRSLRSETCRSCY